MQSFPSRVEQREVRLFSAAERGEFSLNQVKLYPREIRKLQKDGFKVIIDGVFDSSKKLYYTTIDWHKPYPDGIPHLVHSYIMAIITTYPESHVNNFAQKLFIIAKTYNRV